MGEFDTLHLEAVYTFGFGDHTHNAIANDLSSYESIIEQRKVQILTFHQSIKSTGIEEQVVSPTTGYAIVPGPTVDGVIEWRTDQFIVP